MVYDDITARGDCSQISQRSTTLNTAITTTRAFVFFVTLVLSNRDISDELWSKRPLSCQQGETVLSSSINKYGKVGSALETSWIKHLFRPKTCSTR